MRTALLLSTLISLAACRGSEPDANAPAPEVPAPAPAKTEASPTTATPAPVDPELDAKITDLELLCDAVDHDYKDGTLGDYYAGLKPQTAWGKAQMAAGNESIQPGRLLEKAVAELSPGAAHPKLVACRTLLDYLDDVE